MGETVKGMSWKLLYGNYRKVVGVETWDAAVQKVGGPDVVKIDAMDDVPMGPFNAMVEEIDVLVGKGTGAETDRIAQASVQGWANYNKSLVKQLQGDPRKMMEVFATEVHPFFLNDAGASALTKILESGDGHDGGVTIDLPNSLGTRFKTGLLRGFVALTGATADIRQLDEAGHRFTITWTLPDRPAGNKVALFLDTVRAPFLTAVFVPVLVGWALAWGGGHFDPGTLSHWGYLLLTLAAVACFHMGANAINDYFDHKSGADEANLTPTPFSGGSRVIQRGLSDAGHVKRVAMAMYATGAALGVLLVGLLVAFQTTQAAWLAAFGVGGFLIGYVYTAPPLQLAHRGLGELVLAVAFGPLIVLGTWLVFSGDYHVASWGSPLMASAPVALLVAAILYVNQFPDKDGDAAVGKRTLVVRLSDGANIALFGFLVLGAYAAIAAGVALDLLSPWTLLAGLTLPLAVWTVRKVAADHDHPYKLIPGQAATILGLHLGTGVLLVVGLTVAALV